MAKLEKRLFGNFDQWIGKIAVFFKINTLGEEAFLDKLRELL